MGEAMPKIEPDSSISELGTDDTFDWWAITHRTLESELSLKVQGLSIENSAVYFRLTTYAAVLRSRSLTLDSNVDTRVRQAHTMRTIAWHRSGWISFACAACFAASWWLESWLIACLASAVLGTLIFASVVNKRFSKLQRELTTKVTNDLDALRVQVEDMLPPELRYFPSLEIEDDRGHLLAELTFKQKVLAHIDTSNSIRSAIQRPLL